MSKTNYSQACKHCRTVFDTFYKLKTYCSNKCKLADWKQQNPEPLAVLRAREAVKRAKKPSKLKLHFGHITTWKKYLYSLKTKAKATTKQQALKQKPCQECSKPVGYTFGRSKIFCTRNCAKENQKRRPEFKEAKKAYNKRRKAIQRGAKVGQVFSYKQIFERDGWSCQMCKKATPAQKRGTSSHNAPEVDHIIPLSKGGEHSPNNAQTLCRACNGWKSDKMIPAQQGLFTGLLEGV